MAADAEPGEAGGPPLVTAPAPHELRDPFTRQELKRATIWLGLAAAMALVVLLVQPLLVIFGGLVFASMLDGGVRLMGRVLPVPRGIRLLILVLLTVAFVTGVVYMTGVQVADQFAQLRTTLEAQGGRLIDWASEHGMMPDRGDINSLIQQGLGSFGRLTSFLGSAAGAFASLVMVLIIGLFVAMEPRLYERGLQWLVPSDNRREFAITIDRMAHTMRRLLAGRLLGMLFEGVLTWFFLAIAGVPMALLLGILTGLLAFIPNIGAFISGVLMIAVGFSAGQETGFWAIAIYFGVQTFDGYILLPMVARRTVDLPPALTLSSQILASTLFGVLGLALADPMVAMIKVALQRGAEQEDAGGNAQAV